MSDVNYMIFDGKKYENVYGLDGYPAFNFELNETVFDDLTRKLGKILKITGKDSILGYWLDNDYLGGGRHPWELTKIRKVKDE